MANTVSILSYANTFGDWIVSTNALANENNNMAANNYHKTSGTLYLDSTSLGLQVAANANFGGQLSVQGIGSSAYIAHDLVVGGNTTTNLLTVNTNAVVTGNTTTNLLTVNTNAVVTGNTTTNILTVNTNAVVGNLTTSNTISANVIQANTSVNTRILTANSGAFSGTITLGTPLAISSGGTGLTSPGTAGNVLTSNGTTWQSTAPAAGVSLSAANTWSGTQTFNGTSSTLGTVLLDSAETVNIVAAAPAATTNLYVQSGAVQYYTSNAANNFIVNLAFSSGTSMNTAMTTGQSVTAALITTQSTTAYYGTAVYVDGTAIGVTTRWIGGAPTAGNASGLDTYRFAVIKTAASTYTVLASLTQYKA